MKLKDQGRKHVHFADNPEVHAYSPGITLSSSSELHAFSDNRTLPLPFPSMPNHVSQCPTSVPSFVHVPSPVLVRPDYMLVGSPVPVAPVVYRVPVPMPAPALAVPTIHPALARPRFRWDVRATALPTTLTRDQPSRAEPAFKFSPPLASRPITLRFAPPQGHGAAFAFAYTIAGAGGAALRVVDVLRAIHDALYTRADRPRDAAVLRAAKVAEGYRALLRDGGPYRVDLYPVSPNRVDARLYFVRLEWGEEGGEVRVLLGRKT